MLILYNESLMINHSIGTSFVCSFQLSNKKIYTMIISITISGSSNLDNYFIIV